MIGRRILPADYLEWNRSWGAPFGRRAIRLPILRNARKHWPRLVMRWPRLVGPFAFQSNSVTRRFEYPWAYHAVELRRDMDVVELGGGLSGFQFVLARLGLNVTNVDPGDEEAKFGWPVDERRIRRLNRAFRTNVQLVASTLRQASIPDKSTDIVYSISTIEHIPPHELPSLMVDIRRILRPGGYAVLTVDLFLDLEPFSDRNANQYGTNVAISSLVEWSGLELVQGKTEELLGFPEFDHRGVLGHLSEYLIGYYPGVAQCLVLRRSDTD